MHWHLRVATGAAAGALLLPVAGSGAVAEAPDEDQLSKALLNHMDFTEEWAADSEESAEQRGIGVPAPQEKTCRVLFRSTAPTSADAGFARTETGPFVTTTAAAHPDGDSAQQAVEEFRKAAESCDRFRAREGAPHEPGEIVVYRAGDAVDSGVGESHGDEVATVRFHRDQESPEAPEVVAEAALVRVGEYTVLVSQTGRDDQDTGALRPLVERAVAKLSQIRDGRTPDTPRPSEPGTEL